METLRTLLYPLGFIASLLFFSRFFIQWLQSEKKKQSLAPPSFWIISLTANTILALHATIQLQLPIAILQALNGVIAWRNLNLMRTYPRSFRTTVCIFLLAASTILLLFISQGLYLHTFTWMRAPTLPWINGHASAPSSLWHLIGLTGMLLFASRFWIQWWHAERAHKSTLPPAFWKMSLIGACLSLIYFIRLIDAVQILGYSLGIIPYARNLVLLKKASKAAPQPHTIFLLAGEQSGDVLGSKLIASLKKQHPHLNFVGVGGDLMAKAGLNRLIDIQALHVMGFSEVFKALPRLFFLFRKIKRHILNHPPAAVIFIDYPDFNMLMAKALKKSNYQGKLIHFVCPSIWAWRKNRRKSLVKNLDLLLSTLPFEKALFEKTSLPVTFVGHPLAKSVETHTYSTTWKQELNLPNKPIISLFPGSRHQEISLNLPLQLETAKKMLRDLPEATIAISIAHPNLQSTIKKILKESNIGTTLVPQAYRYELMQASHAALATSGTIVLELGLHSVPTVVTYKLSRLNYLFGRYLFKIILPHYTLVNIICDKEVYPEFIHRHLSSEEIYLSLKNLINKTESCQAACQYLKQELTPEDQPAEAIYQLISQH